tara:strand:- start:1775 stop:2770 length:996 start_codon:yes stop_codon:yes gene_type:complete
MNEILKCLLEKDISCDPVWFMRQAGRYLPEFQEIRKKNKDFIKLCFNPALVKEITLQPLKRFDLDAAIIFSDILLIPFALGQNVAFKKSGPTLSAFNKERFFSTSVNIFKKCLDPVYQSIKQTRYRLDKKKSLIGFVGAPWTLIYYMLNIKSKGTEVLNKEKKLIKEVIENLNKFICIHIKKQFESGADIIQLFDSWAGLLEGSNLSEFCIDPNKKIISFCKKNNIPNICFPKGIGKNYKEFTNQVKSDGISIDYNLDPEWAADNLKNVCIQGGMDPKIILNQNEKKIMVTVDKYLEVFNNCPYIFNLGHGILPNTRPDLIRKIVERVKSR